MNLAETSRCPLCKHPRASAAHRRAGCSRKIQAAHAGEPPVKAPPSKPWPDRIDADKRRWHPGVRVR